MIRAPEFMEMFLLLEEHPEWRAELRRLVLTEELLALPELIQRLGERVDALIEAHARAEERLSRTEERLGGVEERLGRTEERLGGVEERLGRTEERLDRLEGIVQELAEAQRRTEMRVEELAEAQRRTDEAIKALAEAQRRTDEAIKALAEAQRRTEMRVEELAEAQRRTEMRVEELAEAQRRTDEKVDRLAAEVGSLSRLVGATAEGDADSLLRVILPDKGYELLRPPYLLRMDGDVDVVAPAAKDGQTVWVVVEAKVRIGWREVEDWANRMRSEGYRRKLSGAGVPGPYLVYAYGIRADAGAEKAARTFQIGLITGQGEVVSPGSLLPPVEESMEGCE